MSASRIAFLAGAALLAATLPAGAQRGGAAPRPAAPAARPSFTASTASSVRSSFAPNTPRDVLGAFRLGPNAGLGSGASLFPRTNTAGFNGGFPSTPLQPPPVGAPNNFFPSRTTGFSTAPLFPYSSATFPYGYGYSAREYPEESQVRRYFPEREVTPDPNSATMNVRVPADAAIWFQGAKTGQRGEERTFVSPPLEPGRAYTYEVRARWNQDGKEVEQTRQVRVRAGETVKVDFEAKK
jgi:uncharacterized protein (TIGR03000 family)